MRKLLAMLMVCAIVGGFASVAAAQTPNRALIALGAFKGITFNNMFDKMPDAENSKAKGMSMGTMIAMIKANLQAMETDPMLVNEKLRIGEILTALAEVEQELAADPDAGKKSIHEYYEADQEPHHNKFVKKLKDKNFENKGLSIPFLGYNSTNNGHQKFKDFMQNNPGFLGVLGNMSYQDFFLHTADEPWVNQTVMDMLDAMHSVHLLGNILVFVGEQNCDCDGAEIEASLDTIWPEVQTRASNMCCDRITRKCVYHIGMNCNICNQTTGACCIGQPWCP